MSRLVARVFPAPPSPCTAATSTPTGVLKPRVLSDCGVAAGSSGCFGPHRPQRTTSLCSASPGNVSSCSLRRRVGERSLCVLVVQLPFAVRLARTMGDGVRRREVGDRTAEEMEAVLEIHQRGVRGLRARAGEVVGEPCKHRRVVEQLGNAAALHEEMDQQRA